MPKNRSDKEDFESFKKSQEAQKRLLQEKVTELEKSAEELNKSNEHLRQLIGNAGQAFTIVNSKGAILYSGSSLNRILGYNPDDLTGTDFFKYIHPDDNEDVKQTLKDIYESTGTSEAFEFRHKHRDESWRHLECFAKYVVDVVYGPCIYLNLWDVAELADSLKKVKTQLTLAQRISRIGSWKWDVENDQLTWLRNLAKYLALIKMNFLPP